MLKIVAAIPEWQRPFHHLFGIIGFDYSQNETLNYPAVEPLAVVIVSFPFILQGVLSPNPTLLGKSN